MTFLLTEYFSGDSLTEKSVQIREIRPRVGLSTSRKGPALEKHRLETELRVPTKTWHFGGACLAVCCFSQSGDGCLRLSRQPKNLAKDIKRFENLNSLSYIRQTVIRSAACTASPEEFESRDQVSC